MFKRISVTAVSAIVAGTGLTAVAPAADAGNIYANCTALHTKWKHGVGRQNAVDHTSGRRVTNFYRNTRQYNIAMQHKRDLDRDRDGIACEKR